MEKGRKGKPQVFLPLILSLFVDLYSTGYT